MQTLEHSQVMQRQELSIAAQLHLLIVEDVKADVDLMILALESAQIAFTYDIAKSQSECQHLLQTQTYDAILADYRLPQFTAYQVLQLLQASGHEIPLILVTGSLGEEAAVDCIKAGMTDYVMKERLFRLPVVLKRSLQEFELRRQQQQAAARTQLQAQQQAIINHIVHAMRETLVLDEVLQITADMLHQALGLSRCLISQPNSQAQMGIYHISAATREREHLLGHECSLYPFYQDKLLRGEMVIVRDMDENVSMAVRDAAGECNIRALIIAPLLYRQSFLGGIILHQCERERDWTEQEISLVGAISDQCAIAIHQVQLFSQVQQQLHRQQTLNQISQALNSILDPDVILQEIVRLTGECFDVDRLLIFSVDTDSVQILKEWRASDRIYSMLNLQFPKSEWIDLIDPDSDFYCQRYFHAPDYSQLPSTRIRQMQVEQASTRSVLSVPIFIRDRLFGGLSLQTTNTYRTFTHEEIYLLQQIADQAAIALYNAQSYERLEELVQQRTQELEAEKLVSETANRAKSEFLSNISHELRTPLTGILGFSGVLMEQIFGSLNAKQKQYIECIHTSGKHLLDLINDLLDLTKIEAGKEELTPETLSIEDIAQACLSLFQERCRQRGLEFHLAIASEAITCTADRRRLNQILVNLLSNALKFTDTGSITLRIEQTSQQILFSVIDTGIGIALEDCEAIFQPFHQVDSGLNRKYEGTGLGLALSRRLAQLHGGDITVRSELRRGSCFTLYLPGSRE
ncbi:histidine kinase [Chroococcidiopsis sp. CCALA 051]|uniref:hybrid sensor histidine kinase/response regulator n=1 Tax=Chroococcidiopsis sp. CCALA 051 TaxID=869949 RepID=UPI000D0DBC83|nr:GAF domain-containing protein [Chroococcidiopsis sp. CCALA 051]PSM47304.1 histidine kinase [Chroococcidiopsis sp. CCALA 051]